MSVICYLGLGANLNDPKQQIINALHALAAMPQVQLLRVSSLYGSQPLGPQDQPNYMNVVAEISTTLSPLALLDALQQQEQSQGRVKLRHWGERCIDLDILLYGKHTFQHERLNIPHKELKNRSFVVVPLHELSPSLVLPDGAKIAELTPAFIGGLHKIGSLELSSLIGEHP